ncbi:MAG: DUF3438 family protein [Gammaproteobacteria bacterium]|nr:DUF3438 family protein [Gammaproteobacteria bacterium]
MNGRFALIAGLLWASAASADTVEWERTPIAVTLAVGVERQIRFEGPATVGAPADLIGSGALRAEFANDTAYWLATEPFAPRRIKARMERTGEFVLFDVGAVAGTGGTAEVLEVRVARPEREGIASADRTPEDPRGGVVALVRHAARLDLAPTRLAAPPAGTVPVETATVDATALYRHPDRARLRLAVRGQVSRGGLFVTTLEASNVSADPVELDVRHLRAEHGPRTGAAAGILAVGWTRSALAPAGEPGFTARLYVATDEPFDLAASP